MHAQSNAKVPLVVLLDGDAKQWESWCQQAGWLLLARWNNTSGNVDERIKALEGEIKRMRDSKPVDEHRVYLAGQGEGASGVFYVAARIPDLWAAAVAIGGTPRSRHRLQPAFRLQYDQVPVLWITARRKTNCPANSNLPDTISSCVPTRT